MGNIKVFLSDPQILFREGIHFTLSGEEDFEVTGETNNNVEALAFIEANPPDVAILNMTNGKLYGSEIARRIKRNLPTVLVILVADNNDEEQLFSAMKSGASACLTLDADPEYLISTIRVVTQGSQPIIEALLIPGLASRVLGEFEGLSSLSTLLNNLLARLSPKETEVLSHITTGDGIEQVATKLNSNEESIRRRLRLIVNKLVANAQAQAIIEASQQSLPSMTSSMVMAGKPVTEYITREKFSELKESVMLLLESFKVIYK